MLIVISGILKTIHCNTDGVMRIVFLEWSIQSEVGGACLELSKIIFQNVWTF